MTPFPGTPIHEMALRGEGGYRLLSGGWEDFDKYSSGVLELETVSLGQLKRYQIACYVNLYVRNRRFLELGGSSCEPRGRLGDAGSAVGAECGRGRAGLRRAAARPLRLVPHRRHPGSEVVASAGTVAQVTRT